MFFFLFYVFLPCGNYFVFLELLLYLYIFEIVLSSINLVLVLCFWKVFQGCSVFYSNTDVFTSCILTFIGDAIVNTFCMVLLFCFGCLFLFSTNKYIKFSFYVCYFIEYILTLFWLLHRFLIVANFLCFCYILYMYYSWAMLFPSTMF